MITYRIENCLGPHGKFVTAHLEKGFRKLRLRKKKLDPDFRFCVGHKGIDFQKPGKRNVLFLAEKLPTRQSTSSCEAKLNKLLEHLDHWTDIVTPQEGVRDLFEQRGIAFKGNVHCLNFVSVPKRWISKEPVADSIKCIFIGWLKERRRNIVKSLQARNVLVKTPHETMGKDGPWFDQWNDVSADCGFSLNIHFDESKEIEFFRMIFGMATNTVLLSEKINEDAIKYGFANGYNFVAVDSFDQVTEDFLKGINRKEIVKKAHDLLRQFYLPEIVAKEIMESLNETA